MELVHLRAEEAATAVEMKKMHVLVSGANRGLGLALVKELLSRDDVGNVYATHRHWADIKDLQAINDPRLFIREMELMEHITIGSVYVTIRDTVCADGLNVIINNAAILEEYDMDGPVKRKSIVDQLEVNCVGPTIVCQGFLPQMRKAVKAGGKAMIINVSDHRGSMAACTGATDRKAIVYQMSKAALNMMTRTMAADAKVDGVIYMAMAPGSVKTDMGGAGAESTAEEAAKDMVESILHKVTLQNSGEFYDRNMNSIPF